MNNYQQQPRETINTQVGLNSFLTKMFGWMGLAVLVSAATAFYMVSSGAVYAMREIGRAHV